jgi:hypothetical protein
MKTEKKSKITPNVYNIELIEKADFLKDEENSDDIFIKIYSNGNIWLKTEDDLNHIWIDQDVLKKIIEASKLIEIDTNIFE